MEKSAAKKCGRCKEVRPVSEFNSNATRKDGLQPYCKVCSLAYRLAHKEAERTGRLKNYYNNLEAKRLDARRRMQLRRALIAVGKEEDSTFAQAWEQLCARNAYRCFCCGREKPLRIDHVLPIAHGGADDITNLQPLCASCHRRKGNQPLDYRPNPNQGE